MGKNCTGQRNQKYVDIECKSIVTNLTFSKFSYLAVHAKDIWKRLTDRYRYYEKVKKPKARSGDDAPDPDDDVCQTYDCKDELAFLSQFETSRFRDTGTLGGDSSGVGEDNSDDQMVIKSNYSYSSSSNSTKCSKKNFDDDDEDEVKNVSDKLAKLIDQQNPNADKLEFDYIWRQLDRLFKELSPAEVMELNGLFFNETFKKIQEKNKKSN